MLIPGAFAEVGRRSVGEVYVVVVHFGRTAVVGGVVVRGASAEVAHSVGDVSVGRSDGRGGKDAEVAHAVGDVCVGRSDGRGGKPESNGVSGRWIKSSGGVVGVRRGVGFVSVGGRCGVVHGGGGGNGGVEEVVEWELCCFGGNEGSSDENFGSSV